LTQHDTTPTNALRDDIHVIWLRKWLVVIIIVAFTLTAFLVANSKTRMYAATARMMYQQQPDISDPLAGSYTDATGLSLQVQSVVNTVNSPAVTEHAASLLEQSHPDAQGYSVTAAVVPPDSASGTTVSDVVEVTAASARPLVSAAVANAYAQSIIDLRIQSELARLHKAQDAIRSQMAQFSTSASKLSTDYLLLLQRLRDLQVAEATVTGGFTIVQRASVPTSPYTPKPFRSAVIGFGVGLIAGVALAYVIGQFDTRVRSHREAGAILGLPVVARVPRVSRDVLRDGPLVSLTDPSGDVAEAFRVLRSNLDWMRVDGDVKTLLFTSSQKGEGKTLTVCNLAVTLALAGKAVVVVDSDLRDPRVHRSFSMPNATGLSTVISDSLELGDALQSFDLARLRGPVFQTPQVRTGGQRNGRLGGLTSNRGADAPSTPESGTLQILTSGPLPPNPGEVIASQRMATVLRRLVESNVDYVLIDAPPVLSFGDAGALAPSVDGLLFVVNLGMTRRPTLEDGREALDSFPCRILGALVVGERPESSHYHSYGYASPRQA
jgi:polysaccharide biosynthesis transport protein